MTNPLFLGVLRLYIWSGPLDSPDMPLLGGEPRDWVGAKAWHGEFSTPEEVLKELGKWSGGWCRPRSNNWAAIRTAILLREEVNGNDIYLTRQMTQWAWGFSCLYLTPDDPILIKEREDRKRKEEEEKEQEEDREETEYEKDERAFSATD